MPGKKEPSICSRSSDQQPFTVNLKMEAEDEDEEGDEFDRSSSSLDEGINEEDCTYSPQQQNDCTQESSDYSNSNSMESLATNCTSFVASREDIPSIAIISPTPTDLPKRAAFARFHFSTNQNISNTSSTDQEEQKTETKVILEVSLLLDKLMSDDDY